MINRRFMIVPPAVPSGGHAEQLEGQAKEFPCLQLETANMRESPDPLPLREGAATEQSQSRASSLRFSQSQVC